MTDSSGAQSIVASDSSSAPQAPTSPVGSPVPAKHRVKIDGAERELTTDELIRDYQLREASNKRFQEASQKEKRAQPVLDALEKKEFRKLLEHVPKGEFRKFAEDFLLEEIEYEELPETEKRRLSAEQRARQLEEELKRRDEHLNKETHQRALQEAGIEVDNEISAAIQKKGIRADQYIVKYMLDDMIAYMDATGERLPAAKALERAIRRRNEDADAYYGELPADEFVKRLPPEKLDAIRKHLLSQVGMQPTKRQQAPSSQRTRDTSKPLTIDAAFDAMSARFSGKKGAKK